MIEACPSRFHVGRPTPGRLPSLAVLLLLGGSLVAGPVRAAPNPPAGLAATSPQQLVDEGVRLFEARQHAAALDHFQRAHHQSQDPQLLYLIGRCQEELGQPTAALASYEAFVQQPGGSPQARGGAETSIRRLREQLAQGRLILHVAPFGAEVAVDGEPVGVAPVDPRRLPPGRHTVTARATGRQPRTETVEVPAGGDATVRLELEPILDEAPGPGLPGTREIPGLPAVDRAPAPFYWPWVTLGLGLTCGVVGGVLYADGASDHRELEEQEGYGGPGFIRMRYADAQELKETGETKKTAGVALLVGSGVSLAATGVLFLLQPGRPSAARPADATAAATRPAAPWHLSLQPTGAGLLLQGRF